MRAKCERMRTEARSEERSFKMEDLEKKGHGGESKWLPAQVQTVGTSFFPRGRSVLGKAARLIIMRMKLKCPYVCLSDPQSISSRLLHPPHTPRS